MKAWPKFDNCTHAIMPHKPEEVYFVIQKIINRNQRPTS